MSRVRLSPFLLALFLLHGCVGLKPEEIPSTDPPAPTPIPGERNNSPEDPVEVEKLIRLLTHESVEERSRAETRLISLGTRALPPLEQLATDLDAELRERARKIIRDIRLGEALALVMDPDVCKIPDGLKAVESVLGKDLFGHVIGGGIACFTGTVSRKLVVVDAATGKMVKDFNEDIVAAEKNPAPTRRRRR